MTRAALPNATGFGAPGFRRRARTMHRPRIALLNPSWLAAAGALGLSAIGIAAIGTVPAGASTDHATPTSPEVCTGRFRFDVVPSPS